MTRRVASGNETETKCRLVFSLFEIVFRGVSERLQISDQLIRRQGMRVGHIVSLVMDEDNLLNFDGEPCPKRASLLAQNINRSLLFSEAWWSGQDQKMVLDALANGMKTSFEVSWA